MLKKTKLFLAFTLVLVMCLTSIPVALAAEGDGAVETNTAAITKLLKVPYGTTVPTTTFKFLVTRKFEDSQTPTSHMPIIGEENDPAVPEDDTNSGIVTISFTENTTYTYKTDKDNVDYYYLESEIIFKDGVFDHAGVFEYEIREIPDTYTGIAPFIGNMNYSDAVYTVRVYVIDWDGETECNHTPKHTVPGIYITNIGAFMTKDDDGAEISTQNRTKVDPTPGTGGPGVDSYSKLMFTNEHWKTKDIDKPSPEDGDFTLAVSKKVAGAYANFDTSFNYRMTITVPTMVSNKNPSTTYKAFVMEKNPLYNTPGNETAPEYRVVGSAITFTSKTPQDFQLKSGQTLVFEDTPVGTKYEVEEFATHGYIASVDVTYNSAATPAGYSNGTANSALKIPTKTGETNNIDPNLLFVGEGVNKAAFTNTRSSVTPTGLDLNDLPFIALILLAVGSFVAFIVVKSRKKKSYNQ